MSDKSERTNAENEAAIVAALKDARERGLRGHAYIEFAESIGVYSRARAFKLISDPQAKSDVPDINKHAKRLSAALRTLQDALTTVRLEGMDVTIFVIPHGEYDAPKVGVRLSLCEGKVEDVVWIGMPVPPSEEN